MPPAGRQNGGMSAARLIRAACIVVFVGGIAGMIVSSINGNNNGWVVTFGLATAVASLIVLATAASTRTERLDVFADADAERFEERIAALVGGGADEAELRRLVRDVMRAARR